MNELVARVTHVLGPVAELRSARKVKAELGTENVPCESCHQAAVENMYGAEDRFSLVFQGGSGSTLEEIRETLDYGVIKMNIDTDMQYALTRPNADHMFTDYDGVLMVDGEVGDKKAYDPRSYLQKAEEGMARRVVRACEELRSVGTSLGT